MSLFNRTEFESFVAGLPATELVRQWGDASVGKVGGKIFAILSGPGEEPRISFKCSDTAFELLPELDGVIPAPYLARAKWVALGPNSALSPDELDAYLTEAHRIIASKLPRRLRETPVLSVYLDTR